METIENISMEKRMPKVEIDRLKTYLAIIKGSVGTEMFRTLLGTIDGMPADLTEDGLSSCAYFVSSILGMANFRLLNVSRATVSGLMKGLEKEDWVKENNPSIPGQVIIWEETRQLDGEPHMHAGFYLGGEDAISHVDSTRTPQKHHFTFGVNDDGTPVRKIIAVYTHEFLKN